MQHMAKGDYWGPLQHALDRTADPVKLQKIGFQVDCPPSFAGTLDDGHALILEEDMWAEKAMVFAHNIIRQRWCSLLWHSEALPGRFALLTDENPLVVGSCLASLRDLWALWQEATQRPEARVRQWVKRSYMGWVVVRETMEALAVVGFQSVPEATRQQLKDCFST
eukprot:5726360-Lingulodinium_polyedra.AAC.1